MRNGHNDLALVPVERLETRRLFAADPWQTVGDFQYAPGFTTDVCGLGEDAAGNLYAAGAGRDAAGVYHATVMKRSSGSADWAMADDFTLAAATGQTNYEEVKADGHGNVFAVGRGVDSTNTAHWIVRRSADAGTTWTTVDDFQYAPGRLSWAQAVTVDAAGAVFVAGYCREAGPSLRDRWIVRKSADAGATWTTVESFVYGSGNRTQAHDVVVGASGVYVVGLGTTNRGERWLVRRSTDGGATWGTLDDFQLAAGANSVPKAVSVDDAGRVFVCGSGTSGGKSPVTRWLIRRSVNGGASWSNADDFTLSGAGIAMDVASGGGKVYATGYSTDAAGRTHYLTRASTDSGATWSTSDDLVQAQAGGFMGRAVIVGSSGDCYTAGALATSPAGGAHGVVRCLAAASPFSTPPVTLADREPLL